MEIIDHPWIDATLLQEENVFDTTGSMLVGFVYSFAEYIARYLGDELDGELKSKG